MTHNKGRTKVVLVLTLLLVTVVLSQTILKSRLAMTPCEVTDIGLISQTYTDHAAIFIDGNADFLSQASAESWEGDGSAGNPIIIEGYNITDTITEGIKIWNVDLHWIVRTNLIDGGPPYACGLAIDNCSNGEILNNIIRNRGVGIQAFEGTHNCSFLNNQIMNNDATAFKVMSGMSNCIISGNTLLDNVGNNIWITGGFNDSQVINNTVRGGQNGIRITVCIDSTIIANTVSDTALDALVFPTAIGVVVAGNSVTNTTGCGIMTSGSFADIHSNTVINSTASGIYLATGDNGTIAGNLVVNSSEYGLKLGGTTANNTVSENSFIDNIGDSSQVLDNGEDNIIRYNHYSDWISPDENTDGIVDLAYSVDGDGANSDPYPIVDSAGTIPATNTGNEVPIELLAFAAIGVVLVLLVVVFLKRRN
ncbi:MAG: right-handed parallel beta-helix repeat-containing protein [Candidatus Thorarchaeota archaeon]